MPLPEGVEYLKSDTHSGRSFNNIDIEDSSEYSTKEVQMSVSNSRNSSKEDPKLIQEDSFDSLDSQKERIQIRIEEESGESESIRAPDNEYVDNTVGISDITLSNRESEEEYPKKPQKLNLDIPDGSSQKSNIEQPFNDSSESLIGQNSSKEIHEVVIHEETDSFDSGKESRTIIHVDMDPSSHSLTGSAKESQRASSKLVPLPSEHTEGSQKERLLTELEKSDHSNENTIGSDKEMIQPSTSSVTGSIKERQKPMTPSEKISSLESEKEEPFEQVSLGSSKEMPRPSTKEADFGSEKSPIPYLANDEIDGSQIEINSRDINLIPYSDEQLSTSKCNC